MIDHNAATENILEEYLITLKIFLIQLFKVCGKTACTIWGLLFKYVCSENIWEGQTSKCNCLFLNGKITGSCFARFYY